MQQLGLDALVLADAERFETFWSGEINAATVTAIAALSRGAGELLVYVHGPRGIGKTHLAKAARRNAVDRGRRAAYLPLDQALMLDPALIEGWGELDLAVIDALESIAGYSAWERALFRLTEELRERGAGLLILARSPPDSAGLELPDLASRLAWGPIYGLEPLDDAELVRLARHLAHQHSLDLPPATAAFLVNRLVREPAAVVAAMAKLDVAALTAQRRLTTPFVRSVLFPT